MSTKTQQSSTSPLLRLAATVFLTIAYYLLLFNNYWGAGFAILNFLFAVALFVLRRDIYKNRISLFYLLSSLVLSAFLPFRSFEVGWVLTVLAVFVLNSLAVSYGQKEDTDVLTIKNIVLAPILVVIRSFNELLSWIAYFVEFLKSKGRSSAKSSIPKSEVPGLLRGGVIAIPLVTIFTALLIQADPAFKKFFEDLIPTINFNWNLIRDWVHMLLVFSLISSFLSFRKKSFEEFGLLVSSGRLRTEMSVAVMAVSVIIGLFLFIQARTLFAGDELLKTLNLTYSEYTRQGFGQLVAVSAIGLALVTFLLHERKEKSFLPTKMITYIFLGEILLLLLSATRRVYLYQNEFGFTQARLLGFLFSLWLFGTLAIFFFRLKGVIKPRFLHFAILVNVVSVLFIMQAINVDRTVATIRKPNLGHSVDYPYIVGLSTDAWPAWEDAIRKMNEESDNCGKSDFDKGYAAEKLINNKLLSLRERRQEYWKRIGNWNLSDIKAKQVLEKNFEGLDDLRRRREDCVLRFTSPQEGYSY